MSDLAESGSRRADVLIWRQAGQDGAAPQNTDAAWHLAQEAAVAIVVDGSTVAVMMATPADLEDMARGFLLSEGYIAHHADVRFVSALKSKAGICLDLVSTRGLMRTAPERAMEGRTGCGLCGVTSLADAVQPLPFRPRLHLDTTRVDAAFAMLGQNQPMKARNHSVHGAGFAGSDGNMLLVREDVGRHNALDKLIGAVAKAGLEAADGFAVMTSRCSYELVKKAATAGLGGLATISAPTTLALDVARQCGLPLACRAPGGVALFN